MTRSRRGPGLMVAGASALVALALGAPGALAAPASEVGDAGDLPDTAQRIDGDQAVALDSISGELVLADDDSLDMYRICLTGGRTFSAAAPADNFDPQLFLFDEEGRPVFDEEADQQPPLSGREDDPIAGWDESANFDSGNQYTIALPARPSAPRTSRQRPVLSEAVLADEPRGYWRFGESEGETAFDSSPNDDDGTYLKRGDPWCAGRAVW
ncbi:MAG: hypothetical protein ACR2KP_15560 [Egibacteraceae bacterium]